jgi:fructose-1,6-bisphosphatase/inositol monophosphatase family enzyme
MDLKLRQLLDSAITDAANSAANVILKFQTFKVEQKTNPDEKYDEVTEVDYAAQKKIVDVLQFYFPNSGIVAEEDGLCIKSRDGITFTIDPIDGTKEFVRTGNEVSIMIGVVYNNQVIASIILNPFTSESYFLSATYGDVSRIRHGIQTTLTFQKPARNPAIFSFEDPRDPLLAPIEMISDPNKNGFFKSHMVFSGSYGTNILKVASNVISACVTVENNIKPWDEAPALGILKALGYKYYLFNPEDRKFKETELVVKLESYRRPMTLITHPTIFEDFIKTFE